MDTEKEGTDILRPHAEDAFKEELRVLRGADKCHRPKGWMMSPAAVCDYIMGGMEIEGIDITPKYFGDRRLVEVAIATLATDRALMLTGIPGTAKTWLSEHLAAAISGDSTLVIQGTAGLDEDAMRYSWNYARLIAEGPSAAALVVSPLMSGMQQGKLVRIEELTRISSDVQDTLITMLSEKVIPVPELNTEVQARRGFNVIATANDRDRGVNDLSSALRRRLNTVVMPLPGSIEEEIKIVKTRVDQMSSALELPVAEAPIVEIRRLVTIFRELRSGVSEDGTSKLRSPSGTLSPAEAVSVMNNGLALAAHFGSGKLQAADLASGLLGAIIKDPIQDRQVWEEYVDRIIKQREGWADLYEAFKLD